MEFYVILALTAFAAAFIQGVSGFAFAVILLGVLPHFIDYIQAVGLVSLLAVIVVGVNAWTYRAHVQWKLLPAVTVSYIIATKIGVQILVMTPDANIWGRVLGVLLAVWAGYMIFGARELNIRPTVLNSILWGVAGGLLGGLFGMAPIMAFYFLAITSSKETYMGSMQMFFLICVLFDVIFRIQSGIITLVSVQMAAAAVVFVLLGFVVGHAVLKRISLPQMQKFIYGIIFISGILLAIG